MNERELFEKWFDKEYSNYGNSYKKTYDDKNDLYGSQFVDERYDAYKAGANREGYKLVPLEPTQSMIDNAVDKTPETPSQDYWHCSQPISDDQAVECYKAMIGAVDEST